MDFLGMGLAICLMLAGIVVLATGAILTTNLISFRSTAATEAEMLKERGRIVNPCLIMIGMAAAFWVIIMTIYISWFIISNANFARTLLRLY